MEIQVWPINEELKEEANRHYRTAFALALESREPWEIISRLTFDSVAPNLTLEEVRNLFDWVNKKILHGRLVGQGVELGAGAGFMSAVIASSPKVEKVYAVEVVENVVRALGTKIVDFVLEEKSNKVIGCVGDFNHLQLPDQSVDFAFDFYSLHHSDDLEATLAEIFRILKQGGFLFCFDKARDNKLTELELVKLLDQEYTRESKILMGLSPGVPHTRRQNGEKEYRLADWEKALKKSGFLVVDHFHLARLRGDKFSKVFKKIVSWLPVSWQVMITAPLYRHKKVNNLEISNLVFCPPVNNFPKEISLIIAHK